MKTFFMHPILVLNGFVKQPNCFNRPLIISCLPRISDILLYISWGKPSTFRTELSRYTSSATTFSNDPFWIFKSHQSIDKSLYVPHGKGLFTQQIWPELMAIATSYLKPALWNLCEYHCDENGDCSWMGVSIPSTDKKHAEKGCILNHSEIGICS